MLSSIEYGPSVGLCLVVADLQEYIGQWVRWSVGHFVGQSFGKLGNWAVSKSEHMSFSCPP